MVIPTAGNKLGPGDAGNWPERYSFRSKHTGGLQFAMADGSVHFIDDGIALTTWRALATRAGGEVICDY